VEEIVGDQQAPETVVRLIKPEQVADANGALEDRPAHGEGQGHDHREPPGVPRGIGTSNTARPHRIRSTSTGFRRSRCVTSWRRQLHEHRKRLDA
jgi:hypothetical protein